MKLNWLTGSPGLLSLEIFDWRQNLGVLMILLKKCFISNSFKSFLILFMSFSGTWFMIKNNEIF